MLDFNTSFILSIRTFEFLKRLLFTFVFFLFNLLCLVQNVITKESAHGENE